jgi:hypothetical protein
MFSAQKVMLAEISIRHVMTCTCAVLKRIMSRVRVTVVAGEKQ